MAAPTDISPIIALIPEKIRSEIVMVGTVLLIIAQQLLVFEGHLGSNRWYVEIVAGVTFIVGIISRGAVTPTHKIPSQPPYGD